jgi:hypothetical protein
MAHACHPSYTGSINRKIMVCASQGKRQDSTAKITKIKGARGVDQAVEHLPNECKALSGAPSATNKNAFTGIISLD